ncbi:MAG: GNAT family N-acetyltransferase, partial [Thermoproteota archaeon]
MKSEVLELLKPVKKRWLKPLQKYRINIEYTTGVEPTPRTLEVSGAFGLGVDRKRKFTIYKDFQVDIGPQDIVYITGDSGSGKSVLLRWLEETLAPETVNIDDIQPDPDQPLIEQIGETFQEGLRLLCKAGLNDAFLFVRRFKELSDGQKYRFKVAKMMESEKQCWVFDEFCSVLDRDTAKIVAYNVQKLARQEDRAVIVATTHTDLREDLGASVYIRKRYGDEVKVDYWENKAVGECSLMRDIELEEGSYDDWKQLAGFHYRSHNLAFPRQIFILKRADELCGVIGYSYPASTCFGRSKVFQPSSMQELNDKLSVIRRIVVHPKYRTIGLGRRLVEETLDKVETRYVE